MAKCQVNQTSSYEVHPLAATPQEHKSRRPPSPLLRRHLAHPLLTRQLARDRPRPRVQLARRRGYGLLL